VFDQTIRIIEQMLTWKAGIDIFFIATGIFFIYHTLRRLGTWKILVGILVAMFVFVLASILDLTGTRWIFSNLSKVALIALIVIFQPEMRKLFERAAFLKRKSRTAEEWSFLQVVSGSVFALAEQKRGAILVFPGKESITEWVSGGFPLNADPTFPLIMSIFDPHSPGHDGAMIMENGKISHFGVRLPLSKTDILSNNFGTRHHAAMGLSEVSDAFIVVVSEERGTVTVFHNGKARETQEESEIVAKLSSHFEHSAAYSFKKDESEGRQRLRKEVAVSTLLALALWSSVVISTTKPLERGFSVPVEYVVPSQKLALIGDKPTEVKLLLDGPKDELDRLKPSQIAVRIDLSEAMPGKLLVAVTEENLSLPKSVKLREADPSSFVLNLQQLWRREATVVPQLIGKTAADLSVALVEVNPPKIWIFSPLDKAKQKKVTVMTTPIYLESIKEDTTLLCQVIPLAGVRPAEDRWPLVEVAIKVSPKREKGG